MEITKKVTKEIKSYEIDWKKVPEGTYFIGTIEGIKCYGQIQSEGEEIFLCQNRKDGSDTNNKFSYKYSWTTDSGSPSELLENGVKGLKLYNTRPKEFKVPKEWVSVGGDEVRFLKGKIKIGCQDVSNEMVRKIVKKLKD